MIHYISPYSIDKNIGSAINQAITKLNAQNEDWIVHVDQDACFLHPFSKAQLEDILNNTDYDLLGPMTNRLANDHQLVPDMFNQPDMNVHVQMANKLHNESYGIIMPYNQVLAAFCLCFRVKTWKELGGFKEKSINFDTIFSVQAMQKGLKLGLMTGIYLFHCYRWGHKDPESYTRHLR